MSFDQPPRNKMMTSAPEQKEFHFSGDGIWRNKTILAETRGEAETIWRSTRQLIDPAKPPVEIDTMEAIEQSTAASENAPEEGAVQ